jgi:hypothetical protein
MNNVGDFLLCKEDFYDYNEVFFQKGNYYEIINFKKLCCSIIINLDSPYDGGLWYEHNNHNDVGFEKYYVWNYFYSPAEIREMRINQILEDD